jgi:hypothetical protein
VSRLRGRLGAPPDPIVPPPNARTCPDQLVLQCRAD